MVFKCAAYGCKSGYRTSTVDSDLAFHSFPTDKELHNKWIWANPRKDFIHTKHSRLCSLHFQPHDFVDERRDTNKSQLKKKGEKHVRRHLKEGVVPSVFLSAPAYLSKSVGGQRSTSRATSAARRADEEVKLEVLEESFSQSDDISALKYDNSCKRRPSFHRDSPSRQSMICCSSTSADHWQHSQSGGVHYCEEWQDCGVQCGRQSRSSVPVQRPWWMVP